jgi:excisionase family DNA binding protein
MSARLQAAVTELVAALVAEIHGEATKAVAQPDQLYDIPTAARLLSIGRSRLYSELNAGRIRAVRSGRRVLVPASEVTAFANNGASAAR